MKAVGYREKGSIDRVDSLVDLELEDPVVRGRDLLVRVKAVSVNPVDTKVRTRMSAEEGEWKVLGYDASGVVEAVGEEVVDFEVGDEVFYAGAIDRPGTNSELHLVDERIVGRKPESLTFVEAAALPLTAITAWEMLFDRLEVRRATADGGGLILVIGGAGGVGSIAIQLLRALTDIQVIATASREETREWVKECGAHYVIDHREPLAEQVDELGLGAPGFVFSTTMTGEHFEEVVKLIAPQGRFGLIDDPDQMNVMPLKQKAVSTHWEFMFARPLFETSDLDEQGRLLNEVARLVDEGKVKTTLTEVMGNINAETLKQAHTLIESGKAKGKIGLEW